MGTSDTRTETTAWAVLDASLGLLRDVAAAVTAEQRTWPTPCTQWNVGQVLFHATYDQFAWASCVDGGPSANVDPFSPPAESDVAPSDLVASALKRAAQAWATVAPGTPHVATPLPTGPMSAESAARACAMDAAVHAWDVAVAIRRPSGLTDDLAGQFLPVARTFVEPLRQWGAFGPILAGPSDEGAAATLLRYLGRDPNWTP